MSHSSVAAAPFSLHPALSATPRGHQTRDNDLLPQRTHGVREKMLLQLHGQQIRIPDLGRLMEDWPRDQNPHLDAVDSKILQIIER